MPEQLTYLLVDFFCILVPFVSSFHPRIRFYRQWRNFWLPCVLTAAFFIVWDVWFTRHGVWSFNSVYVCGIYFFSLPLEEYMFFVCVPYASVFTWFCIDSFFSLRRQLAGSFVVSVILIVLLVVVAACYPMRLYTSVTFALLALFLVLLLLLRVTFLKSFYIAFLLLLIPFFISNGVLTGTGLKEPVVMYNNRHNLGIRMLTIPVEDTFYGMLLILMNVAGFELMKCGRIARSAKR